MVVPEKIQVPVPPPLTHSHLTKWASQPSAINHDRIPHPPVLICPPLSIPVSPALIAASSRSYIRAAARASDAAAPPATGAAITITAKLSAAHPATPAPASGAAGAGLSATLPAGLLG